MMPSYSPELKNGMLFIFNSRYPCRGCGGYMPTEQRLAWQTNDYYHHGIVLDSKPYCFVCADKVLRILELQVRVQQLHQMQGFGIAADYLEEKGFVEAATELRRV